jgi:hypothetical protein
MPELQVLNGSLQWKTIPVSGERFLIGRKENCHLVLNDGWVSREHTLILEPKPGEFRVQDLDSENGTFLNGDRIRDTAMKHGDVLRVGRTEMRFMQHANAGHGIVVASLVEEVSPEPGLRTHAGGESEDAAPRTLKVDALSKTSADEGARLDGPRIDLRERVRRLEARLLEGEQGNAALATENAVLKRALAKLGVLDRTTGDIDPAKLLPRPSHGIPPSMLRLVSNPLARITFPGLPGETARKSGNSNPAALDLGVVGIDALGIRFAECLARLGYRRAAAITAERDAMRGGVIDPGWRIYVDRPKPGRSVHQPGVESVFVSAMPKIDEVFAEAFGGADRVLLCADAGAPLAVEGLSRLGDAVRRAGSEPGAIIFFDPLDDHVESHARAEKALAEARLLAEGGRFAPFLVVDLARAATVFSPAGTLADPVLVALDSIAGGFDAVLRLATMPSPHETPSQKAVRDLLLTKGWATLGLAGTADLSRTAAEAAFRHALGAGLLCHAMPASRARSVVVCAIAGAATAGAAAANDAAAVVARLLPQARCSAGVYEDAGEATRVIAFVGGLPYPETFFSERSAGTGRRTTGR